MAESVFEPCAIPDGPIKVDALGSASSATARYFNRLGMTPKTSIVPDTVMKVRIRGVSSQMNRFRYLYGIILGELLLKHANNLS